MGMCVKYLIGLKVVGGGCATFVGEWFPYKVLEENDGLEYLVIHIKY